MGLAVVLGVVRTHNGVITVESKPDHGSIFRVYFPVSALPQALPPVGTGPQAAPEGGGTVLVVEDDESVRNVAAATIRSLGFTVLTAHDGIAALQVYRQHPGEVRCVLCDLIMPRMDGWETLAALRQLEPGIPVILASGYGEASVMAGKHPEQPQLFLSKPYSRKALQDAIAYALAHAKG